MGFPFPLGIPYPIPMHICTVAVRHRLRRVVVAGSTLGSFAVKDTLQHAADDAATRCRTLAVRANLQPPVNGRRALLGLERDGRLVSGAWIRQILAATSPQFRQRSTDTCFVLRWLGGVTVRTL